jgi:ATP-dependent 26S proteasome regulatory subunit
MGVGEVFHEKTGKLKTDYRKLIGKYGRELLLYGPPGTGKHQTLVMHV